MSKVDWSQAPEDAQFYVGGIFTKYANGFEYSWDDELQLWLTEEDTTDISDISEYESRPSFERRPTEQDADEVDMVNNPPHYQSESGIECIDAIRAALTPEEFRGYCKGNAIKYVWRERNKGQDESMEKAVWYLNKELSK